MYVHCTCVLALASVCPFRTNWFSDSRVSLPVHSLRRLRCPERGPASSTLKNVAARDRPPHALFTVRKRYFLTARTYSVTHVCTLYVCARLSERVCFSHELVQWGHGLEGSRAGGVTGRGARSVSTCTRDGQRSHTGRVWGAGPIACEARMVCLSIAGRELGLSS